MAEGQALPQATFFHTNPHNISRFELPPNFIFQCYRPQTWQFYIFFPALSFLVIHKVTSLRNPLLQKANYFVTLKANVNIKTLHFQFAIYLTRNE